MQLYTRQFKTIMFTCITSLYQQHASHMLASRVYGPEPHSLYMTSLWATWPVAAVLQVGCKPDITLNDSCGGVNSMNAISYTLTGLPPKANPCAQPRLDCYISRRRDCHLLCIPIETRT